MNRAIWLGRAGILVASLLCLGLFLVAGGTAHESMLLTYAGVSIFAVGAVCLSLILLLTYRADANG